MSDTNTEPAPRSGATTTTTRPALVFNSVSKTFPDGTNALSPTSFSVGPGEFVTVVGPSGCGKSTLLRIASGLEKPTGGSVEVDRATLGYVFQDATLLQWRTVRKNVQLFAELDDVPKDVRDQRVAAAIELVGLTGFEDKYPRQLSGGMRMRASLARSLVMDPQMFLFDEPFGALDEITRERLNDELLNLFLGNRFGSLFITHSIFEAVYLSTRVVVMSARPGRIVATFDVPFGYPRSPELRFDADFGALSGEVSHALRGAH
jgi:NitT/TauT family transport system ATP-binding protein